MNPRVFVVSLLLHGLGPCALVYQTVWLREFRRIFGASTMETAAVPDTFMGGIGLGGRLLAIYAILKLGIVISAGLTPFLITLRSVTAAR